MSVPHDSPVALVARFLRSNEYNETLETFLSEANLPPTLGLSTDYSELTIENVLEEKKVFDLNLRLEKATVHDGRDSWRAPAPTLPHTPTTLPLSANILHVSVIHLLTPSISNTALIFTHSPHQSQPYIIITASSRTLHILSSIHPYNAVHLFASLPETNDSPILCTAVLRHRWLFTTAMSGRVTVFDMLKGGREVGTRRDHWKYAVKLVLWDPAVEEKGVEDVLPGDGRETEEEEQHGVVWLATAGWDSRVFLYRLILTPPTDIDHQVNLTLSEPVSSLTLPTKPESILFIPHPDAPSPFSPPLLLLSRRDSTLLHFYSLPNPTSEQTGMKLQGTQNLTPNTTWTAYTPSCLALHPTDKTKLAIGTSSIPHMRLLLVRLLFPAYDSHFLNAVSASARARNDAPITIDDTADSDLASALASTSAAQTSAPAQARNDESRREEAAILQQTNTLAPQTAYSTPTICWRPCGTGVWTNAEDGCVRGVETSDSGKVRHVLKRGMGREGEEGGHEPGAKVRCLWSGLVDVEQREEGKREEWVVSGGFDGRVVVWRSAGLGEAGDSETDK